MKRPCSSVLAHTGINEEAVRVDLHVLGAGGVFLERGKEKFCSLVDFSALSPPRNSLAFLGVF